MKEKLTIDEVAELARVSVPTIYRRVKLGDFPKPIKVPTTATRGPKNVNRWERAEVMGWLLKGKDPRWINQPVRDIKDLCAKLDKAPITGDELSKDFKPTIHAFFKDEQLTPEEAARRGDVFDIYDFENAEPPSNTKKYIIQAAIGGILAGFLWAVFHG